MDDVHAATLPAAGEAERAEGKRASRLRVAVLALVLVGPALWWLRQAFVVPTAPVLPPSSCGEWMVHPDWDVFAGRERRRANAVFPATAYRLTLPAGLAVGEARVATYGEALAAAIDGRPCPVEARRGWTARRVDLAACGGLGAERPRLLELVARRDLGPPPIRVCWPGGVRLPPSGEAGWTALTAGAAEGPAVPVLSGEAELRPRLPFPLPSAGYGALVLGLGLVTVVGLGRGWIGRGSDGAPGGVRVVAAIVVIAAVVQIWNASRYPWQVSRIDASEHAERLRLAAHDLRPPPADASYLAYHPPLYYWMGGLAVRWLGGVEGESLRPAQILGAIFAVLHLALLAWLVLRFGPASRRARALALATAALAPVALTVHPMLGNEALSALLSGVALVAAGVWLPKGDAKRAAAVGLLAGLALLTKYTGLMPAAVAAGILALRVLEGRDRRRALAAMATFCGALAAVAGWFYVGRWLRWGTPFISNWAADTRFFGPWYEPGYRTLGFYTRFGDVFRFLPERALWSSYWDGVYANVWGEINDSFLPLGDLPTSTLLLVVYAFALVPTMAALAGFGATVGRAASRGPGVDLATVAVTAFTVTAVSVFSLELPHQNSVKASYLLSLWAPAALFAARGYALAERGLGRWAWILDVAAGLQVLLVLRLFVW